MTRIVYSCPDCLGDLEDEGWALWCARCETSVPYAVLPVDDGDPDDQH